MQIVNMLSSQLDICVSTPTVEAIYSMLKIFFQWTTLRLLFQGVVQPDTLNYTSHCAASAASEWLEPSCCPHIHHSLAVCLGYMHVQVSSSLVPELSYFGKIALFHSAVCVDVQQPCLGLFSNTGICRRVEMESAIKEIGFVCNLTKNKKCKLCLYLGVALNGLLALFAGVGVQAVITRDTVSIFFS